VAFDGFNVLDWKRGLQSEPAKWDLDWSIGEIMAKCLSDGLINFNGN